MTARSRRGDVSLPAWVGAGVFWLLLFGLPVSVASQLQTSSEERFFRIEWQLERADRGAPAIVGTLKNEYFYPIQQVQLQVQILDASGQIIQETIGTTNDVPPGGRSSFRLPLPATGARYLVTVHSFHFGAGQSP